MRLAKNFLIYEDYEKRRLDGNYSAVQPRVLDSSFKLDNSQAGSNEGAEFIVPGAVAGELDRYYVKFGDESASKRDHLWTEVLADRVYATVTPDLVPETEAVIVDGRLARRSKLVAKDDEPVSDAARNAGFIIDCLVGNWDAVFNAANLLMSGGKALRIDTGNSFDYRARGDKKEPSQFDEVVHEIEVGTNNSNLSGGMRQMYPNLSDDDIQQQIAQLQTRLTDDKIDELVHGIRRSSHDRLHLARVLKARKRYIIEKLG